MDWTTLTRGEMAMCTNLLQGHAAEWALLRRHPSEDIFGIQVCGGYSDSMSRCAQLLEDEVASKGGIDFVDINMVGRAFYTFFPKKYVFSVFFSFSFWLFFIFLPPPLAHTMCDDVNFLY